MRLELQTRACDHGNFGLSLLAFPLLIDLQFNLCVCVSETSESVQNKCQSALESSYKEKTSLWILSYFLDGIHNFFGWTNFRSDKIGEYCAIINDI